VSSGLIKDAQNTKQGLQFVAYLVGQVSMTKLVKKRLSLCRKIKEDLSPSKEPVSAEEAPNISYWAEKITELSPSRNLSGLYPINKSLLIAIETILFIRELDAKL
jgi:hypothetical protein